MNKREGTSRTKVAEDGLRYTAKPAGSLFGKMSGPSFSTTTMSCFLCGAHRPPADLIVRKLVGKSQRVCGGGCKR